MTRPGKEQRGVSGHSSYKPLRDKRGGQGKQVLYFTTTRLWYRLNRPKTLLIT
jgi:hypothetical protein